MGATQRIAAERLLIFAILFSSLPAADFSMRSLVVSININEDGSAHVEERLDLLISGSQSRELYETTRSVYNDLATWKERTNLAEMRHHISRANAEITNLRVIPESVHTCNSFIDTCLATVRIDYSVVASSNGSGLVKVERYKPRTSAYSLVREVLSFEQTKTGDLVLPKGTKISISIPQAAEKIYFSTVPQNLKDETDNFRYDKAAGLPYYIGKKRVFEWEGDTLSEFRFSYEIEFPLETEVLEFFSTLQRAVVKFFSGEQGIAAIILIVVAVASILSFNKIKP
ncbi:MAG: hypothetical protein N3G22_00030 [Candidatus Micrarchaeota archaeon]|nr:hypothetical protein [Candidatus Micrarchaeota archaeon]